MSIGCNAAWKTQASFICNMLLASTVTSFFTPQNAWLMDHMCAGTPEGAQLELQLVEVVIDCNQCCSDRPWLIGCRVVGIGYAFRGIDQVQLGNGLGAVQQVQGSIRIGFLVQELPAAVCGKSLCRGCLGALCRRQLLIRHLHKPAVAYICRTQLCHVVAKRQSSEGAGHSSHHPRGVAWQLSRPHA